MDYLWFWKPSLQKSEDFLFFFCFDILSVAGTALQATKASDSQSML